MDTLLAYWSRDELATNGILLLHLIGALATGILIGYERSYHGRVAGMRMYALVCVASTILTAICGFPQHWFAGLAPNVATADPTRVIQGVMTGVGFLGAGVIMKEGFTVRGLSTAASVWMTAAIGIVIGVGFYGAAIAATFLTLGTMVLLGRFEHVLPHEERVHLTLAFPADRAPGREELHETLGLQGFRILEASYHFCEHRNEMKYALVLQTLAAGRTDLLAGTLASASGASEFELSPARG